MMRVHFKRFLFIAVLFIFCSTFILQVYKSKVEGKFRLHLLNINKAYSENLRYEKIKFEKKNSNDDSVSTINKKEIVKSKVDEVADRESILDKVLIQQKEKIAVVEIKSSNIETIIKKTIDDSNKLKLEANNRVTPESKNIFENIHPDKNTPGNINPDKKIPENIHPDKKIPGNILNNIPKEATKLLLAPVVKESKLKQNKSTSINYTVISKTNLLNNLPKMQNEHHELYSLHERIKSFTSKIEIYNFYNRDKITEMLFQHPLDLKQDRKLLQTLFPKEKEESDRIIGQLNVKLVNTTTKKILFWHSNANAKTKYFEELKCNIKDCVITNDQKQIDTSDAVMYKTAVRSSNPSPKRPNQVKVFSNLESAGNFPKAVSDIKIHANWSETYRVDSVLVAPYERFTPYSKFTELPKIPIRNFAKGKTKRVAWFVSNCKAKNNRFEYVKELQKYITVDIYGGCGKLKCKRTNKGCFKMLQTDYKFYLSFENTNCKDYITEKLYWNAYQNDVVPIVMGAHPNDYKRVAPPRSYIHVDMFHSAKQLAEYLKFLDKNDDLYNSYFLWKNTGDFINTKSLCRLCAMVHLAPINPMWYDDTNRWWSGKDICRGVKSIKSYATWKVENIPIL